MSGEVERKDPGEPQPGPAPEAGAAAVEAGRRLQEVEREKDELFGQLVRLKAEFEKTGVPFYVVGETFSGDAGQIASFVGPARIQGRAGRQIPSRAGSEICAAPARTDVP